MIKFIQRLFGRKPPIIEPIMPSIGEARLLTLAARVSELEKELKHVRDGARRIDLLAVRAGENAKGMQAKFRLVKNNYVNMKINISQMMLYLQQPKILNRLDPAGREKVTMLCDRMLIDGAVDPECMTGAGLRAVLAGHFKLRELQPLLAISPDFEAQKEDILKEIAAPQ